MALWHAARMVSPAGQPLTGQNRARVATASDPRLQHIPHRQDACMAGAERAAYPAHGGTVVRAASKVLIREGLWWRRREGVLRVAHIRVPPAFCSAGGQHQSDVVSSPWTIGLFFFIRRYSRLASNHTYPPGSETNRLVRRCFPATGLRAGIAVLGIEPCTALSRPSPTARVVGGLLARMVGLGECKRYRPQGAFIPVTTME